jgi:hypothetical protein
METEHAPAFALVAFSDGKPVSTPDQVRGRHFPENAPAALLAAAAARFRRAGRGWLTVSIGSRF